MRFYVYISFMKTGFRNDQVLLTQRVSHPLSVKTVIND